MERLFLYLAGFDSSLGTMTEQAKRHAKLVPGWDAQVGPTWEFNLPDGSVEERPMNKYEFIFGISAVRSGCGRNHSRQVAWHGFGGRPGTYVIIRLSVVAKYGTVEVYDFVREIIQAAGWRVVKEEKFE